MVGIFIAEDHIAAGIEHIKDETAGLDGRTLTKAHYERAIARPHGILVVAAGGKAEKCER